MIEHKIKKTDNVRTRLLEAVSISNDRCEPVLIIVGERKSSTNTAVLIGEELWAEIYDEVFTPETFSSRDISFRGFDCPEDNPDFEKLKRAIEELNGIHTDPGSVFASNILDNPGTFLAKTIAQLVNPLDWEAIEETYEVIRGLDDGDLAEALFFSIKPGLYEIVFSKKAEKQYNKAKNPKLKSKIDVVLDDISSNPFSDKFHFEFLKGKLAGYCSKRVTYSDRVVYNVKKLELIVGVIALLGHYDDNGGVLA